MKVGDVVYEIKDPQKLMTIRSIDKQTKKVYVIYFISNRGECRIVKFDKE